MVTQKTAPVRRRKKKAAAPKEKPLWEALRDIADSIPEEAWDGFPTDAAKNFDDLLEPEWVDGNPVFKQ